MPLGIRNDRPRGRRGGIQCEARFQIRLVEARKRHARVHRDEERVEIFARIDRIDHPRDRAVRRRDGGVEIQFHTILTRFQRTGRQQNMSLQLFRFRRHAIDADPGDTPVAEIERQRLGRDSVQDEVDGLVAMQRIGMRHQFNAEPVTDVVDERGPLFRQILRHAGARRSRPSGHRQCQRAEDLHAAPIIEPAA